MKIQNLLRTQTIGIAVAAAFLFFAGTAQAQEITNTEFNDGPFVVAFPQPTTSAAAVTTITSATGTDAVNTAIANPAPVVAEQAIVALEPSAERSMLAAALFAIALLALYVLGEVRRANRNFPESTSSQFQSRAALS
jgi:hypothetical protein